MLLLILVANLVREQVPSILTTLAVLEMKIDYLTVLMTCILLTVPTLRMLDSDAVEDVSSFRLVGAQYYHIIYSYSDL